MRRPDTERFLERIVPEPNTGCWLWTGGLGSHGYAQFWFNNQQGLGHRWSYKYFRGPLLPGYTIDHLCRVRSCVNPHHLEQVTYQTNILRGIGITAIHAR